MTTLDFESDQFLQLLTDALRAGPGSPEWHEAVAALRNAGSNDSDEYRLLINARENLEKGKEYRSVRAGPGFGRKLNDALDDEASRIRKSPPTAGTIAIISAGVILTAAAVLLFMLFPGNSVPTAAIERLSNTYFVEPILDSSFESGISAEFDRIGALSIDANRGLHPAQNIAGESLTGGGIVWTQRLAAHLPIAIDTTLRINRPTDETIAEIFITDAPDFSGDKGTSEHEFLWLYQAGQAKVVLPDGTVKMQTAPSQEFKGLLNVRVALERDAAIVSQNGKIIWSGAHELDPSQPRYIGLRFIKTGPDTDKTPAIAFQTLKVSKP